MLRLVILVLILSRLRIPSFLAFITFFILITFHTSTSRPWIYPPIALYTAE